MPDASTSPEPTVVDVYTDGGCDPNPGPGGWGAVLVWEGRTKEISGGCAQTTNNRMELTAAIEALRALVRRCDIAIYTDSRYVRQGITRWVSGWQARGWKKANGQPVENQDLWQELLRQTRRHGTAWHWVKGHSGHPLNERADALATIARRRLTGAAPGNTGAAPAIGGLGAIAIYARGCALGAPGPGGYCAVVVTSDGEQRAVCGAVPGATSNAMELHAAVAGLEALDKPANVTVHTPSKYLVQGASLWLAKWMQRGWRTKEGRPVKNEELWKRLERATRQHRVTWLYLTKSTPSSEEAIRLARSQARRLVR